MRTMLTLAAILLLVALGLFYTHGSFDRPLSSIGLNYYECARNGLGATFCGQELDEYRERIKNISQPYSSR